MGSDVYEVISLAARSWFTFLGVLIVWRSFRWLRKDRKAKHRRLKQLPDAGMVGELVVLDGSNELPPGTALPLPREGTLGCLRTCDELPSSSGTTGWRRWGCSSVEAVCRSAAGNGTRRSRLQAAVL